MYRTGISKAAATGSHPPPWIGRLLVISLLVMLNLPVILTGTTGMDQYGFFTLEPVASRPWPLALSIALGTFSAGAGYLAYRLLQRRAWFAGNRYEAYHRNAVVFGVSVAIAYLPAFFLTGYEGKPLVLGVAGIMAVSLCLTASLNDRKTSFEPALARLWFVVFAAFILVFLTLSVVGMLAMYFVEHSPSDGNFFWSWEFAWSDLGYPAEEFNRRYRNGLLAFGISGTLYMTVALGGPMLGAVLRWTTPDEKRAEEEAPTPHPAASGKDWKDWLDAGEETAQDFMLAMNGQETSISQRQYENLLAEKDILLPDTGLLVDNVSGTAFAKNLGKWKKIPFRGRRKGPFLLLCIYARYPGSRFTTGELEVMLRTNLEDRDGFNISDFLAQLQKRAPLVPVQRDDGRSFIPDTVNVCFLDHLPAPRPADGTTPSPRNTPTSRTSLSGPPNLLLKAQPAKPSYILSVTYPLSVQSSLCLSNNQERSTMTILS